MNWNASLVYKVIMEFRIGYREIKALVLEQICLKAPESTIQNFIEEKIGFKKTDRHILVVYEVEQLSR